MTPDTTEPRIRDKALAHMLPLVPRRLVRSFSRPYIAGSSLDDALNLVERLAGDDLSTTLDVLGESVRRQHETECTTRLYVQALDRLATLGDPDLVNVSIKLTALGLGFDETLAEANLRTIVECADRHGGFVRIDMEDSPYTDATLAMYEALREDGLDQVGVVIQSYLKRSAADVVRLADLGAPVRLVKGIYQEPSGIAFREMDAINTSYIELSRTLAEAGCHIAFATHDELLVAAARDIVDEFSLEPDAYEFQMLLGVTEPLRDRIAADDHPMRVYVPFGSQWYEYSIRRLRENPRVAGYVAADVLRKFGIGRRPAAPTTDDARSDAQPVDDALDELLASGDAGQAISQ